MYDNLWRTKDARLNNSFGTMVEQKCKTCAHKASLVHIAQKLFVTKLCVCDICCSSHIRCENYHFTGIQFSYN